MKALTLHQPWASLIAIGAKRIETRSWSTDYQGLLAIHVAKTFPVEARTFVRHPDVSDALAGRVPLHRDWAALPVGAVVATARLVDVVPIVGEGSPDQFDYPHHLYLSPDNRLWRCSISQGEGEADERTQDLPFGDFTPGRYAWLLADVVPLIEPVPAPGRQGLWEWEPPIDENHCDACWEAWISSEPSPHLIPDDLDSPDHVRPAHMHESTGDQIHAHPERGRRRHRHEEPGFDFKDMRKRGLA